MEGVTRAVEQTIAAEMPDRFGLIIGGWSHALKCYRAVFACNEVGWIARFPLPSMAPLIDEPTDNFIDGHARGDDAGPRLREAAGAVSV